MQDFQMLIVLLLHNHNHFYHQLLLHHLLRAVTSMPYQKSDIWKCFDLINIFDAEGKKIDRKAVCKICSKQLSGKSSSRTSHLKRHNATCMKNIKNKPNIHKYFLLNKDGDNNLTKWSYEEANARKKTYGVHC